MCTDRHIYWRCGHQHSIESPSTACEFYLINKRFPIDDQIFTIYRDKYLENKAKCQELHNVVDFRFEHHVCESCKLKEIVARSANTVREREARREESMIRIAWREDNVVRAEKGECQRTFEQYLESLKPVELLHASDSGVKQSGSPGVKKEENLKKGG
jgi:hypothetical protein